MKYFALFISLLLSCFVKGQFVTEDPTVASLITELNLLMTTNQLQNLSEFTQQTSTLKETLTYIKEANEKLKKINEKLNDIIYYKNLVKTQLNIIKCQVEYIAKLRSDDRITAQEIQAVNDIFGQWLKKSEDLLEYATNTITDDVYEMGDAQRLNTMKEVNDEMTDILCQVNTTQRNFDYISRERELENAFKNW